MDNVIEFPKGNYGVEFIGPSIPKWDVVLDGYKVPNLEAIINPYDDCVELILDGRFSVHGTKEEVSKYIYLIANALAIGSGYSCHGENSQKMNPFKVQVSMLKAENNLI